MFTELRIYLRLRPYINQLKKECHMKFSWNLVVQILGTIAQALNALGDLAPVKYKFAIASIVGIVQAISGLIAHYSNPDGTPATVAYVAPAKKPNGFGLLMLLLLLIIPIQMARGQENPDQFIPDKTIFVGMGLNSNNQIQGSGVFRKFISSRFYSFNIYDVTGLQMRPFDVSHIQYQARTGLTFLLYVPHPRLSLWLLGDGGIASTGDTTGSSFGGGGAADVDCGKGWHGMVVLSAVRNNVQGTYFSPRLFFGYGWK
jgi:hypothetical protein